MSPSELGFTQRIQQQSDEPSTEVKALRFDDEVEGPRVTKSVATDETALWGAWELWCDLSPSTRGSGPGGRSPHQKREAAGWTWLDDVKSIGVFDTAEGFWGLHNCIRDLSSMDAGTNLYLLRRNIPPMWEHEANRRGGRWSIVLPAAEHAAVDAVWLALRLAAIGESFPGRDVDISGVTASRKRHGFRLSVWTRFANDADTQLAIGAHIREVAGSALSPRVSLAFTEHAASLAAGGSPISRGRSPLGFSAAAPDGSSMSRSTSPINEGPRDPPTPAHGRDGRDFPLGQEVSKAAQQSGGFSPAGSALDRSPPSSPIFGSGSVPSGALYVA